MNHLVIFIDRQQYLCNTQSMALVELEITWTNSYVDDWQCKTTEPLNSVLYKHKVPPCTKIKLAAELYALISMLLKNERKCLCTSEGWMLSNAKKALRAQLCIWQLFTNAGRMKILRALHSQYSMCKYLHNGIPNTKCCIPMRFSRNESNVSSSMHTHIASKEVL